MNIGGLLPKHVGILVHKYSWNNGTDFVFDWDDSVYYETDSLFRKKDLVCSKKRDVLCSDLNQYHIQLN